MRVEGEVGPYHSPCIALHSSLVFHSMCDLGHNKYSLFNIALNIKDDLASKHFVLVHKGSSKAWRNAVRFHDNRQQGRV